MDTKTNIFFHAPKELTTDAFLVWLLYFLDSEEAYKAEKQTFFDSLILKKEDCGRTVGGIELKRQENYAGRLRIDAKLTDNEGNLFSDKMRLIFLQMPCFTKEADECENHFERWIYILKNMEILERMPWAAQNAVFQRLAEVAEVSKLSKEDRLAYDHALKRYRDTLNSLRGAKEEGRAEGILAVARKLKANGIDIAEIVDATGLTFEQINSL